MIPSLVADRTGNLWEERASTPKQSRQNMTIREKCRYLSTTLTIEPIICHYLLAVAMRGPTLNNLLLEMACRVNEGFNDTVCGAILTSTQDQKNFTAQNSAVQQHISMMLGWALPVQSTIPVVLLLFLGSYSDRYSIRKPFLLLPIFGELFATISCMICVHFKEEWSVEAAGVAQYILPAVFGSTSMINMAGFAYVADISTLETRIVRMAMLQICTTISNPIGMALSGLLFDVIGYTPSLLLGVLILTTALFYGIFMVKEATKPAAATTASTLISDIVNPRHVVETFKLVMNSRGTRLYNIIFILFLDFIIVAVVTGEGSVLFWFTQQTYKWKNTDFAFFLAARNVVNSVALAIAVPLLSKFFRLQDLTIIAISFINKIMANIVCVIVKTSYGLYIGMIVGILAAVGSSGIRSQSTKYVSTDDMGKTHSLLSIVEAIAASIATPVYNQGIYSYTRETYSHAFLLLGILLHIIGLMIIMWRYFSNKKQLASEKDANEYNTKL